MERGRDGRHCRPGQDRTDRDTRRKVPVGRPGRGGSGKCTSCHLLGQRLSGASGGPGVPSVVRSKVPSGPRPWSHLEERRLECKVPRPSTRPKACGASGRSCPRTQRRGLCRRPGRARPCAPHSSWHLLLRAPRAAVWKALSPCSHMPVSGSVDPARACPGLFRPGPPSHPHWAFSLCSLTGNVWPCTSVHTAVVPGGM